MSFGSGQFDLAAEQRARPVARALLLSGLSIAAAALLLQGCSREDRDLDGLRADEIDYNWHVRPILSENCFKCHGPDPAARKAELRLDVGELAVKELPKTPGKYAIVPHDPARSELVRRIRRRTSTSGCRPSLRTSSSPLTRSRSSAVDRERGGIPSSLGLHPPDSVRPCRRPHSMLAPRTTIDRFVYRKLERESSSRPPRPTKRR